jgi:hypothetical protein
MEVLMTNPKDSSKKSQKAVKAERDTILLGDISLEVFKMPDGQYRLSQTQVPEAVGEGEISFRDFRKSNSPEALRYKEFRSKKISVLGNNSKIPAIPIELAAAYWVKESIAHNVVASRLLGACTVESIERRADIAFGIKRTEEEYNQRFAVRVDLKDVKRKKLVSAIAHWLHKQKIYGSKGGQTYFKEAHDRINLGLQNLRSRDIKTLNNLPKSALIRDYFDVDVLVTYSSISQIAANFLNNGMACNPLEAIDMAFACYLPSNYIAKPCDLVENINKVGSNLKKMKSKAS